jgi:NADPH-dependent curcumin reductase CurA
MNRVCRLVKRPAPGLVTRDIFAFQDEAIPEPGPGAFRVRLEHISLDPAMRGWINAAKSYVEPVALGDAMRAYAVGHVEVSNHPDYASGQAVHGIFGVQKYAISNGNRVIKVDTSIAPPERWLGGLGMPGWTAYFGLLEVGRPKLGETVIVSAASGAVGSIVGQIAKIKGCRVVGIAGGPEKCRYLIDVLGLDASIDHKAGRLSADLIEACPNGIDVNFENVGGEILDTILPVMNTHGRVALCGLIAAYNAATPPPGLLNLRAVLTQRLSIQGLIVFDWADRVPEAIAALSGWYKEGRLVMREDVRDGGIDAFPDVLNLLYRGENFGKLVLKV